MQVIRRVWVFLWVLGVCSVPGVLASERERVVNYLLLKDLKKASEDELAVSWVYSNEGGVIRYGEIDILGDERKEIIYDRSTRGRIYKSGKEIDVYYLPEEGADPVKIQGAVPLYGFYKREGDKSVFLMASEGGNFDTPQEKAFTKKLTFKEVTASGVTSVDHLIDENPGKEIQELWLAVLTAHKEESMKLLESRGFAFTSPKYSWVSVKDYVSSDYEWKDDGVSDWSSLSEFSREAMTWNVHKTMLTPEFYQFSRHYREHLPYDEWAVAYKELKLPQDYFTSQLANTALLKKMPNAEKDTSTARPGRARQE